MRLALSDVAFAITAGLGRLAQGELGLDDGGKGGNDLYGAFGRDFATRDGRRVMIVALTPEAVGRAQGRDRHSCRGRGARRAHRHRPRHRGRPLRGPRRPRGAARAVVRGARASPRSRLPSPGPACPGGRTRRFRQLATEDPRVAGDGAMFATVSHPGGGSLPHPGLAARLQLRRAAAAAARPGARPAHRRDSRRRPRPAGPRDRPAP